MIVLFSGHILLNENVAKHLSSKGDIIQEIGGVQYFSVCLRMVINIKKREIRLTTFILCGLLFHIQLGCYLYAY